MEKPNAQGFVSLELVLRKFEFIQTQLDMGRLDLEVGGLVPDRHYVGQNWCEELCSLYLRKDCEGCPLAYSGPGLWRIGNCWNRKMANLIAAAYYWNWASKVKKLNESMIRYFTTSLADWIEWLKYRKSNLDSFV